jgi:hypothetical protein
MNAIYGPPAECNIQGRAGCNTQLHAACTREEVQSDQRSSIDRESDPRRRPQQPAIHFSSALRCRLQEQTRFRYTRRNQAGEQKISILAASRRVLRMSPREAPDNIDVIIPVGLIGSAASNFRYVLALITTEHTCLF